MKLKRLFVIFFMMIFVFGIFKFPVAAATTLDVKLEGNGTAYKGQTYTLNINLPNIASAAPAGLMALEIDVKFDNSRFDFVKATNQTGISTGFSNPDLVASDDTLKLNFVNANSPIKKTTFYTIEFKAKSNASGNASFTANVISCDSFSGGIINVPFKVTNKSVGIQAYLSSNAYLKSLSINIRNFQETFSKDRYTYNVNIGNKYDSVEVNAVPEDSNAKVTVTGNTNLKVGNNVVTVVVTAQDGTTKKTYTINVNRYPPDNTASPGPSQSAAKTPAPATPTPTQKPTPTPATESPVTGTPAAETPSGPAESPDETPGDSPGPTPSGSYKPAGSNGVTSDPTPDSPPGGENNDIETFFNSRASIAVGLLLSMIIGLAIGFGFGYYVGRRKNFKSRFNFDNIDY